jgi:hypothetical protein
VIGDWETGVILSMNSCTGPDPVWGKIVVAGIRFDYTGVPGDIILADHPEWPRAVWDCYQEIDPYCLLCNGGVGKWPIGGDGSCICYWAGSVVEEESSWGAIKALYRP